MKKILSIFAAFMLLVALPVAVHAGGKYMNKNELVTVPADTVIEGDYFAAGERVEIFGTINGDVYVAGGEVIVDGTVNGDLLAVGGMIKVSGTVSDDIRIAGGDLSFRGTVGQNVSVFGGEIEFIEGSRVAGNVVMFGGNTTLGGTVNGNVKTMAGMFTVSGDVEGNVEAMVGEARLTSQAEVGGDFTYKAEQKADISGTAVIGGETTYTAVKNYDKKKAFGTHIIGAMVAGKIYGVLAALLLGFVFIHFAPKYVESATMDIKEKTWPALLYGLVTLIIMPIVAVLLMVTVIGIPLGLMTMAFYFMGLYIAPLFFMVLLGQLVMGTMSKKYSMYAALLVGAIAYAILTLIPIIGGIIALFAVLAGIGSMAMTELEAYKKMRKAKVI